MNDFSRAAQARSNRDFDEIAGEREREKVASQRASQGARTLKLLFVGFQRDFLSVQAIIDHAFCELADILRSVYARSSFFTLLSIHDVRETLEQQCVTSSLHSSLSLSLFVRLLDMRFSLSLFLSVLSSSSWESLEIDSRRGGCEVFLSWKGRSVGGGFDGRLIRLELNGKWKQRWIPEHFYF